jgi:hypothetical protein
LDYKTPAAVYFQRKKKARGAEKPDVVRVGPDRELVPLLVEIPF